MNEWIRYTDIVMNIDIKIDVYSPENICKKVSDIKREID